jgi:DNA mismatch repair protein MutS
MDEFNTPMMKQYAQIKKQYQDCLLFYRMGDFYELFMDDAQIGAKVLNITLTGRPKGKDGRIPMAGVPFHAVDIYLNKLVKAGYKVAICEQMSLPNKKGIIEREVVRVVTPGTILDENALSKKENNFITSVLILGNTLAIAWADLSTGFLSGLEKEVEDPLNQLQQELAKIQPVECILNEEQYSDIELLKVLKSEKQLNLFPFLEWSTYSTRSKEILKSQLGVSTLSAFALDHKPILTEAIATLIGYFQQTQKSTLTHIKRFTPQQEDEIVGLDKSTIINLELFSTIREHDTRGSLISIIDQTITAMGGRLLKSYLSHPLINKEIIEERLNAVELFFKKTEIKNNLRDKLKQVPDIERLLSRISIGLSNGRDLNNLKFALQTILEIKHFLKAETDPLIMQTTAMISNQLNKAIDLIEKTITAEPPAVDVKNGRLIKRGVSSKLDKLHLSIASSKLWIENLEKIERERSGISSLKVRFNKVFGYYIEVSKSNLAAVPENYLRKQTLVNGERFITPELKHHEEIILTAEEKINTLEYEIFLKTVETLLSFTQNIQESAQAIAILDCLSTFAFIAERENYTKPKLLISGELSIKNGRHPVVEKLLENGQFVPNDVTFNKSNAQLLLITGPNMAGKSVYIRQVALITLLAQIGSFVPAESATLTPVDRIFVRSGASDVITSGLSTFMVEMVETAFILNHATEKSLIIMDEIGRGTSTYDGISIAWAIAEYLVTHFKIPPKTLFATHYHELQKLETNFPRSVKNYSMSVVQQKEAPIFLYTITPEAASHSFGVAVAKLAGIPSEVVINANHKLESLELNNTEVTPNKYKSNSEEDFFLEREVLKELANVDILGITPLDALNKLAELKSKLKLIQDDQTALIKKN